VSARPGPGQRRVRTRHRLVAAPYAASMDGPGILLVEDDEAIAAGLVRVFDSQGYPIRRLARGGPALAAATEDIKLVILDLGLPDVDGIDVCRRLRRARPDLAILILSARDQELDVVAGLDAGADDYLVKPFRLSELLARVRAHVRRAAATDSATDDPAPLRANGLAVDLRARRAWRDDHELQLRPKEFDLLALLLAEAGRAVTRDRIIREVWDTEWMGSTKTLDTHVLALRNKLGAEAITTLRGVGYRLEDGS
jgi:DNA-binding response OmpR family regulator